MSEETKNASAEAVSSEETQEQATSINVEIKTQAETAEEKKEADRPGVCCGSCS
ncbi:CCGSCS motif protein [Sedimenticola selenatireducens]|uniref:CCGSCS motif protein n=1 Tax=Sedimenticola selenatireducens TaxID=191960 RepID=A0A557S509_9GAMM|nr:CCGSCS motif protein [Sedimenticola selenatireducens]TVO72491.1 CCGSCS motif protein [Sedimenticola selenatireducens]TVT64746.1 MAG: CCGSCS motif protein [Sedimenticola selenatireducens]